MTRTEVVLKIGFLAIQPLDTAAGSKKVLLIFLIDDIKLCTFFMHIVFLLTIIVAAREAELRQLRKSNTDYEQQNAILQKHIENMKAAVEKLEVETVQQRNNNVALQQHLDH